MSEHILQHSIAPLSLSISVRSRVGRLQLGARGCGPLEASINRSRPGRVWGQGRSSWPIADRPAPHGRRRGGRGRRGPGGRPGRPALPAVGAPRPGPERGIARGTARGTARAGRPARRRPRVGAGSLPGKKVLWLARQLQLACRPGVQRLLHSATPHTMHLNIQIELRNLDGPRRGIEYADICIPHCALAKASLSAGILVCMISTSDA